jgi:hypothetical protein
VASPVFSGSKGPLAAGGDCSHEAVQNTQKIKPQRLSMENEMGEHLPKENDCENRSLVI